MILPWRNVLPGDDRLPTPVRRVIAPFARWTPKYAPSRRQTEAFLDALGPLPTSRLVLVASVVREALRRDQETPQRTVPADVPQLAYVLMHSANGFEREEAFRTLCKRNDRPTYWTKPTPAAPAPNAAVMLTLLRAANDAVPQVRAAGMVAIELTAARSRAPVVAAALLDALPSSSPWRGIPAADIWLPSVLLAHEQVRLAVADRLATASSGPLPTALRLLLRRDWLDDHLERLARSAVEPAVRAVASECLIAEAARWQVGDRKVRRAWNSRLPARLPAYASRQLTVIPLRDTLADAAADPSPTVRRVAGDALMARRPLGAGDRALAERLARDRYPSVAERAAYALKAPG